MQKEFSKEDLARNNGNNGNPAFVSYNGKVFDVSKSFLWKKGEHQALHAAGQDMTEQLTQAPHGPEFLERFHVVGILKV